jgi:hypothetical protein
MSYIQKGKYVCSPYILCLMEPKVHTSRPRDFKDYSATTQASSTALESVTYGDVIGVLVTPGHTHKTSTLLSRATDYDMLNL